MTTTTEARPEAQAMPETLREAYATIAAYGPGSGVVEVDLPDGRAMMVQSTTFDVTGWENSP